jgi:hypothetical protein
MPADETPDRPPGVLAEEPGWKDLDIGKVFARQADERPGHIRCIASLEVYLKIIERLAGDVSRDDTGDFPELEAEVGDSLRKAVRDLEKLLERHRALVRDLTPDGSGTAPNSWNFSLPF